MSLVNQLANSYKEIIKNEIISLKSPLKLLAFLSTDNPAAVTYSKYTSDACIDVGINFELKHSEPKNLIKLVKEANKNDSVNGILVYYPIFDKKKDKEIRQIIEPEKDVEGLNQYWFDKLYNNDRFCDSNNTKKAILPCTPLAILKVLQKASNQKKFQDKTVTIFNRSEVVGEPLAYMIANDGAKVFSFDLKDTLEITKNKREVSNISREKALAQSDIVVSGVPSKKFLPIKSSEINPESICLNFSELKNFEEGINASIYIPRVGAVTVAMLLRNTLRLYKNFQS